MEERGKRLQTVENTVEILDALQELDGAGVSEIASHLDMPPSTAHSYLSTLRDQEFLVKEGGIYYVGMRLLDIGGYARRRKRSYRLAIDLVETLARETEERVQVTIEEHGKEVFLHTAAGERAVRTDARIGKRTKYLHSSASGKSILAHLPEERVERILSRGLPAITKNTIVDRDRLEEELDRVRERGYSYNRGEEIEEMYAVGVPVFGPDKEIVGALSVSGPKKRMEGNRFEEELPTLLMGTANELELNIAYS